MSRKVLLFLICSLVALTAFPAFLGAQGGPPPGPPPFGDRGGFGRGPGGFRVVGVEGCLTNGRPGSTPVPGYAASILRDHKEASFSGAPTDHSSTELSYRDNNGVTYSQITLPAMGSSQASRTVICINDPNLHIRLVVDPANAKAREFQLPDHKPPTNGGQPPQFEKGGPNGGNGQNPPPGVTITHPSTPPSAVSAEVGTFCPDAQTTVITRTTPNGPATSERVFCPSLRLELYSQNSDSHGISTTTATITATGTGVSLAALPVPYPLPSNYAVTVETPGSRGKRGPRPGGPGGPQ